MGRDLGKKVLRRVGWHYRQSGFAVVAYQEYAVVGFGGQELEVEAPDFENAANGEALVDVAAGAVDNLVEERRGVGGAFDGYRYFFQFPAQEAALMKLKQELVFDRVVGFVEAVEHAFHVEFGGEVAGVDAVGVAQLVAHFFEPEVDDAGHLTGRDARGAAAFGQMANVGHAVHVFCPGSSNVVVGIVGEQVFV